MATTLPQSPSFLRRLAVRVVVCSWRGHRLTDDTMTVTHFNQPERYLTQVTHCQRCAARMYIGGLPVAK